MSSRTSGSSRRPTKSVFHGTLQIFTTDETENVQDLKEFMLNKRDIIADFIDSDFLNKAEKVQFVPPLAPYKEKNESNNEEQAIEFFAGSKMTTVYLDGLSTGELF